MPGFIASQIARINRNLLLVALLLAAAAGVVGWLGWQNISAVVLGPRPVSARELASPQFQSDPASYKTIVRVDGKAALPPFHNAQIRRGKGYGTLYCWLLKIDDRELIVEDWSPSASLAVAGNVRDASQSICSPARARNQGTNVLPMLLDQRDWKESGWVLTVVISSLTIAALVVLGLLWWWSTHPERHPVRRAVVRLGDFESTATQIDAEMMAEIQPFGDVRLTQGMLIYTPTFKFDVVRLTDIVRADTKWLQQGKTQALFLVLDVRDGRSLKWHIRKKDEDELLAKVRDAAHIGEFPHSF